MPVYEYECDSCRLRFEKRQNFSEDPVRLCPDCGGLVHRVIQPVGVIFKGSGFYVTDNRGKSSTMPPTQRDGDGKSGGNGKTDAKSESQTEAKTEAKSETKSGELPAKPKASEGASAA